MADVLRQFMQEPEGKDSAPRPVILAQRLWGMAMDGNLPAIKYIYDRLEGAPTQHHGVDVDAVRDEARRLAREYGMDEEEVVREVEAMMRGESRDVR